MSKPTIPPKNTNTTNTAKTRPKTRLSILHQKYKTMSSQNLHRHFNNNPDSWKEYHQISKVNEASFPPDEIPRNLVIKHLENLPGNRKKTVVDLGCGQEVTSCASPLP